MSFDLFLHRFDKGESAPVDRAQVLRVLREHTADAAGRFGFYDVPFHDGSHVEFSASGLENDESFHGCAFHLRSFSQAVITFVYQVAVAGDMVVFNAQGDGSAASPVTILVEASQALHLPDGLPGEPRLVGSAAALADVLGADMSGWRAYRDLVVDGAGNAA